MATPRIKWSRKAFAQIRTLPAVQRHLLEIGKRIAADAGEGVEARSSVAGGRKRARTAVVVTTAEAAEENAKHNTLLRALANHDKG